MGFTGSHLEQFVEVPNATFLRLLLGDLGLFKMDVFVVKCLKGDKSALKVKHALDISCHPK